MLRRFVTPLLVGIPVLLLVLFSLGALQQSDVPGLPVVPWPTLWSLPVDVWIRDAATAIALGAALVGGVIAPRPDPWLGRLASTAAIVWLAAIAVQAVLTVSEVFAVPVREALDPLLMWSLLSQTELGRVLLAQFALVSLCALLAWVVLERITGWIVVIGIAVAAFLPGLSGHSGISGGHVAATVSLGIHVVAATAWIGGLVATLCYLARRSPNGDVVLRRFSAVALVCVIGIAETGLLNASLRMDGPAALITGPYGAIILAKVAVLIALIGFGWRHRLSLRMDSGAGRGVLLVSAAREVAWMGIALGLSVALSRTAPPPPTFEGQVIPAGALILLALVIPLAAYWVASAGGAVRVRLASLPEASAVLVIIGMALVGALVRTTTPAQVTALIALIVLPVIGWLFWTAVIASRSVIACGIVAVSLPLLAWWTERDAVGGLGVGTWLTVALGVGLVSAVALMMDRDSDRVVAS